jgi:uncharacterized membrane protein YbhN (UPF0104 family)
LSQQDAETESEQENEKKRRSRGLIGRQWTPIQVNSISELLQFIAVGWTWMTISMHLHGSSAIITQISIKSDLCGSDCKDKAPKSWSSHRSLFFWCCFASVLIWASDCLSPSSNSLV